MYFPFQVRHAAADRPVGTTRRHVVTHDKNNSEPPQSAAATGEQITVQYDEYFIEHDISTLHAKEAARTLNLDQGEIQIIRFQRLFQKKLLI